MGKEGKFYVSNSTWSYIAGLKIKTGGILRIKEITGRESKREWENRR